MKELPFLTHDLGARNDPKLVETEIDMRGQGKAIWWDLVEMLWENDGYLPMNFKKLAYSLRYATEEEVEQVVMKYGLFEHDEDKFWNRSALERITHKKNAIQAKRDGGRKGAMNKWNGIANGKANEIPNGIVNGSPLAINKLINKQINKDNINKAPTALDIFEIFFFRNLKDPSGETTRFLKHYEERGWTYQDGTPVSDWEQAARDWKPAKAGSRVSDEALNWYRAVWNAAKVRKEDAIDMFLCQITGMRLKDNQLALVYKSERAARDVAGFIQEYDMAGDYVLDFRVSN